MQVTIAAARLCQPPCQVQMTRLPQHRKCRAPSSSSYIPSASSSMVVSEPWGRVATAVPFKAKHSTRLTLWSVMSLCIDCCPAKKEVSLAKAEGSTNLGLLTEIFGRQFDSVAILQNTSGRSCLGPITSEPWVFDQVCRTCNGMNSLLWRRPQIQSESNWLPPKQSCHC